MKFTKKKLLSLIENQNLREMPMDFDSQDRPDQGVQDKLSSGETPLQKIPFPETGDEPNKNFQELLASERYKQVVAKMRQYTGANTPMRGTQGLTPLMQQMMSAHTQILQFEQNHRRELEALAVELVMKELGIPEGSVQYDARIIGMGEFNPEDFNHDQEGGEEEQGGEEGGEQEMNFGNEIEIVNDIEKLDLEKAKRRFINTIIQGASKRGHYMYHYVEDRVRQIVGNDRIIALYGIMMSVNDALYWQLPDETMKQMGQGGNIAGREDVDRQTDPPTIKARAVNFPVLIHELIKGTLELIALHGRNRDEEGNEEDFTDIEDSEDTLEKEMWDLRLGPAIWDRIRSKFPEDVLTDETKGIIQLIVFQHIFQKPAKEFLVFMKEVVSNSDSGKRLMETLVRAIEQDINNYDYEQTMAEFDEDLTDISDETDNDDLKNFISGIPGISLSNDNGDEGDDDDDLFRELGLDRPTK
jgi:hypothetical protein